MAAAARSSLSHLSAIHHRTNPSPAAKDEWDFKFLGLSNHPFIKANYPHHEGIWGWGDNADQVVMMVRNIRKSMVECKSGRNWISPADLGNRLTTTLKSIRPRHTLGYWICKDVGGGHYQS